MQQPSLDVLMRAVDSKYELVVAAAKRGRMLTEGEQPPAGEKSLKPVSIALNEIASGKLTIDNGKVTNDHYPNRHKA